MTIKLKYFGLIADITNTKEEIIEIENETSTLEILHSKLKEKYPELGIAKYSLAVNQVINNENDVIKNNDEVAFLPPFAGG